MAKAAVKSVAQTKKQPRKSGDSDIDTGVRIRQARIAKKMSQAELGNCLGVSFQQIQKYEKGFNRLSGSRTVMLCHQLGVDPNYLLGWKSDERFDKTINSGSLRLAIRFEQLSPSHRHVVDELCKLLMEIK